MHTANPRHCVIRADGDRDARVGEELGAALAADGQNPVRQARTHVPGRAHRHARRPAGSYDLRPCQILWIHCAGMLTAAD